MRMHIEVGDDLLAQLDRLVSPRGRSAFVRAAIERAVQQEQRWSSLEAAAGSIADAGHDWDAGVDSWVRGQRRADAGRVG